MKVYIGGTYIGDARLDENIRPPRRPGGVPMCARCRKRVVLEITPSLNRRVELYTAYCHGERQDQEYNAALGVLVGLADAFTPDAYASGLVRPAY